MRGKGFGEHVDTCAIDVEMGGWICLYFWRCYGALGSESWGTTIGLLMQHSGAILLSIILKINGVIQGKSYVLYM